MSTDHTTEALVSAKNIAVAVTMLADQLKDRDARIEELETALPIIAASPSGKERSEMVERLLTPEDGEQP